MMVLISKNFLIENLSVRFAIPVISVIFKNSAAVTNMLPGPKKIPHWSSWSSVAPVPII